MSSPTERVEVAFTAGEMARLRAIAETRRATVEGIVRETVVHGLLRPSREARLAAVRRMAELSLPIGDIDQVKRESVPEVSDEIVP